VKKSGLREGRELRKEAAGSGGRAKGRRGAGHEWGVHGGLNCHGSDSAG
jgi:hypothetical protein